MPVLKSNHFSFRTLKSMLCWCCIFIQLLPCVMEFSHGP